MDHDIELAIEAPFADGDELISPSPRWLHRRLHAWEIAQLITTEQAAGIREFERTWQRPAESAFRYQRVIATVSSIGGILLAAGIMLLVASNWGDFGRLPKVAVAVAAVVGIESGGYWLRYRTAYHRTGGTFLFVGVAGYGAAIMLVGQVYHYPIDNPNLLLLWFAPVLPLAYLVRVRLIAALGIAVGYVALGYRAAGWLNQAGTPDSAWQILYLALGSAVVAIGLLHDRLPDDARRAMGRPFLWTGSLTVLGITYTMTFAGWDHYSSHSKIIERMPLGVWIVVALSVAACAAAAIALATGKRRVVAAAAGVGVAAGTTYVVLAILLFFPTGTTPGPYLLLNLVLLGAVVGFVTVGVATRHEALVNLALAFFGLTVVSRYIDVGNGMLDTSILMIVGGVLLIGLGWGLERLRRNLITRYELRGMP
jgi:uncharacterized membrane protein